MYFIATMARLFCHCEESSVAIAKEDDEAISDGSVSTEEIATSLFPTVFYVIS